MKRDRADTVLYLSVVTDGSSYAESLASYLTQHGFESVVEGVDTVVCPLRKPRLAVEFQLVRRNWLRYVANCTDELHRLPLPSAVI